MMQHDGTCLKGNLSVEDMHATCSLGQRNDKQPNDHEALLAMPSLPGACVRRLSRCSGKSRGVRCPAQSRPVHLQDETGLALSLIT